MNFVEIVECEMKRKRITGIFNLKSRVVSIIMIIFFPYGGWGVEKGRKTGGVPAETAWWWRCRRRSFFFCWKFRLVRVLLLFEMQRQVRRPAPFLCPPAQS